MDNSKKNPPEWSESDRAALQEIANERAHRKWAWAVLKRVGLWIVAIISGLTIVVDAAKRLWNTWAG